MEYGEFTGRLKRLGTSLGFSAAPWSETDVLRAGEGARQELKWSDDREAVILLSCRVHYNPRWGGYGGHPQLVARGESQAAGDQSPAAFLAPFLSQYRYAQEHIHLTETMEGRRLVSLPEGLVQGDGDEPRLVIDLAMLAEPDPQGRFTPVEAAGTMLSFAPAEELRHMLDGTNFAWKPGRSIPIGALLTSRLFSFTGLDRQELRENTFGPTLLPHLGEIVTHSTPNLRAAEIHLQESFKQTVAGIADKAKRKKVLCLAGLDIDMEGFMGHSEHYFVPWKAFLAAGPGDSPKADIVDQDDLFVRLMQ